MLLNAGLDMGAKKKRPSDFCVTGCPHSFTLNTYMYFYILYECTITGTSAPCHHFSLLTVYYTYSKK